MTRLTSLLLLLLLVAGCGLGGSPKPQAAQPVPAVPFTDRIWRVAAGSDIPEGALYVFLSDNTLLITSATGTPAIGRWLSSGNGLTIIEEGMQYRTEIVERTAERFVIRQHNPGGSVKIVFTPAAARGGKGRGEP